MVLAQNYIVLAQNISLLAQTLAQNLGLRTIKQRTLIYTFGSKLHSFSSKHITFGPNIGSNFDADTSLKV